jgi:GDP-4-dehydro-6-deoxy-D-mannose reductase
VRRSAVSYSTEEAFPRTGQLSIVPTALVTGSEGFLGGAMVRRLASEGWDVVASTLRASSGAPRVEGPKVRYVRIDVTEAEPTMASVDEADPDAVFHFAGQAFVEASWRNPAATLQVNLLGTLHVLEALRRRPRTRFAFAGSGTEYGEPDTVPTPEEAPLRPTSPYALSKAAADQLCAQYHRAYGLPVFRFRLFGTTGPGKSGDACNDFARQLASAEVNPKDRVVRVGSLDRRRDIADVQDALSAILLVMERGAPGEAYNIGSGEAVPVQEILDQLVEMTSTRVEIVTDPALVRRADERVHLADISRLRALGWSRSIPMKETLRRILDHWRRQIAPLPTPR